MSTTNLSLNHCTICQNTTFWSTGDGAGIYCGIGVNPSSIYMLNSILEGNTGNGGMYFYSEIEADISYNDFDNNQNGNFLGYIPDQLGQITSFNLNGTPCDIFYNIFEDPLFVDPNNGDLHLQEDSPCIDAGDPASPLDPDNTITDMGKYYFDQGGAGIEVKPKSLISEEFALQSPFPNPFNPTTAIRFALPEAGWVTLEVFDISGRQVGSVQGRPLRAGWMEAGVYEVTFDGSGLASGVYIYRLSAGGVSVTDKMVLMK